MYTPKPTRLKASMVHYKQPSKDTHSQKYAARKSTNSGKSPANCGDTDKDEWWIVIEQCVLSAYY